MPKKKCTKDGKPGVTWGDSGPCYTGEDKEEKIERYIRAVFASGYKEKKGKKK